ncbi:hypothetical protein C6P40_000943 [Pichia californica]|uniref:RRM domain-containing protein n=1 Tax=Pichia californica TaxID=460514 RepID=A0A9P7BI24_9ASCO|nr:hypothetical protein C6P42_002347 [[Candida] californica]KAG0690859.1 hypothetical protein C6P40_000943 [[Candida] californica]
MSQSYQFPILQLKNLPFTSNPAELYDLLGQFGNVHEIRVGSNSNVETRGQAFVTYTTFKAATLAAEKLSGFNYHGRYLVVKMYTPDAHLVNEISKQITTNIKT